MFENYSLDFIRGGVLKYKSKADKALIDFKGGKMKISKVVSLIAMCLVAFFAMGALVACGTQLSVTPLDSDIKVVSVNILDQNGDGVSSGFITMDVSAGTYRLGVNVLTTSDDIAEPVKFTSADTDIATVDDNGTVTLHRDGEVVITASIMDKSSSVVLVIGNLAESKYTITIEGGQVQIDGSNEFVSATTAEKDSIVALKADVPEGKEFIRWEIKNDQNVVINEYLNFNGQNIFDMPAMNIDIAAIYE